MEYYSTAQNLAILAVFLQVALTFYAIIRMGQVRVRSIRANRIRLSEVALDARRYPEEAQKFANNLSNQFETPILLYAAVTFSIIYDVTTLVFAWLCLGYVATRFVHRYIHVTSNNVLRRFQIFLLGVGLLALAWVILGLSIIGYI